MAATAPSPILGGSRGVPPLAILGRGARGGPIGPVAEGAIGGSGGYPPDHMGDPPWDTPPGGPPRGGEFCTFRGVFNKSPIRDKHGTRIFGHFCTFLGHLDKHRWYIGTTLPIQPPYGGYIGGTPRTPHSVYICAPIWPKTPFLGVLWGVPKRPPIEPPMHTPYVRPRPPQTPGARAGGPGGGRARGGPGGPPGTPPGDPPGPPFLDPPGVPPMDPHLDPTGQGEPRSPCTPSRGRRFNGMRSCRSFAACSTHPIEPETTSQDVATWEQHPRRSLERHRARTAVEPCDAAR